MLTFVRRLLIPRPLPALPAGPTRPAPGQPAPDFALYDQHQRLVRLEDFRGRWLVLYFYPKDFTPGCTLEARGFRDAATRLGALSAEIVGISEDSVESHARFAARHRLEFPLLADDKGRVAAAYGALFNLFGIVKFAKRHLFLIDPQGRIASAHTRVDPARAPAQIVEALERLQRQ